MTATENDTVAAQPDAAEGKVVFWHLRTTDITRAKAFYEGLFGWAFQEINPLTYAVQAGGGLMGCLVETDEKPGPVASSVLYTHVGDLPGKLERALELGAEVVTEPLNVYGTKAFADLRDPTGTVFGLWTETFKAS
ncbi:hypothetical protein UO65_1341 [Actinokineospora spheciospongiae]|uniref:VOC domain-containing protein n=1 Tax=Actinokineospora spheciospongiae TaxID=909613 RepID=W7ISL7_9PSEU|nr:VOC family protein [Actinokineospora spheciospongiae]EWC63343.1 hypothetical protein UO65_1341 [Actinokineospora spheciospongiae]